MYYVRNITRKAVLCYRDGGRIAYASAEAAAPHAEFANQSTGDQHDVVSLATGPFFPLGRIIAPWIRTYPRTV